MATKEHEHGYGADGLVEGNGNPPSQECDEKVGSDLEVGPSKGKGSVGKEDPFGDETNSEVKYRTMAWWSVALPVFIPISRLTACSQASRHEYAIQARDCQRAYFY